ncbi:MAG TPA: nucleoside 2-deoxyribosyltransferase domain-containing protein [Hyphomicrobiales bacterium]|nr:nucleoside 2-deoxyribosyltransferase domain-containing protein [Hyphomicrobiales bacterium]
MKVFLGGTCNGSTWRDALIPNLRIDYFNPVVEDWTPECQDEEIRQRQECDFVLYTITKEMKGVYSIAEAIDDSNKRPEKTVLCLLLDGFDEAQAKSLKSVGRMANENGAHVCLSLTSAAHFLNTRAVSASAA